MLLRTNTEMLNGQSAGTEPEVAVGRRKYQHGGHLWSLHQGNGTRETHGRMGLSREQLRA